MACWCSKWFHWIENAKAKLWSRSISSKLCRLFRPTLFHLRISISSPKPIKFLSVFRAANQSARSGWKNLLFTLCCFHHVASNETLSRFLKNIDCYWRQQKAILHSVVYVKFISVFWKTVNAIGDNTKLFYVVSLRFNSFVLSVENWMPSDPVEGLVRRFARIRMSMLIF